MGKTRFDAMKRETFLVRHIAELTSDIELFKKRPTGMTALSKARDQISRAHLELSDLRAAAAAAKADDEELTPAEELAQLCHLIRSQFTHDQQMAVYTAAAEALGLAPHLRVVDGG